ncbi:MAG: hypothetical protein E7584_00900 [Ruminococcaceae bacterium]|nr:hypothetical protein [Oscillospiraceae bacterium]
MNKRLIALFLCLVMMLSVFLAGCAEDSEEDAKSELEEAKVANNMTLTMWIVSESPVAEEIRNDVTSAINALTRTKYKTQLEIHYLSEEEYFSKLTAAMEAFAESKKQQNANKPVETETSGTGEETTVEEIVTDENGMYRDKYPTVLENQVDIIYIGDVKDGADNLLMSGQEMYDKLRADDWLAPLDEALKGDAKKIKEFVSPTLLSAVQEKGVTYAIPNNNPIGEYTYMCLNKELMDKYLLQGHLTRGSIKSFANEYVYQFIDQISRYESADLLPIDATYDECLAQLAYYWNVDPETYEISNDEFSIFGTPLFDFQPSRGQNIVGVQSLFENEEFTKHYLALNEYRLEDAYRFVQIFDEEGNPVLDEEGKPQYAEDKSEKITFFRDETNADKTYSKYGIKFVPGTLETLNAKGNYIDENGAEYYAVPVAYPTATAEDIYGNMFAVAKTTLSVERSMQVVTYLNTNKEIRNLLQYGIEGQHYTVENNAVSRIADKAGNYYVMDVYATGNAFLAYLEDDMNAAIWENGKKQNRDSLVEPLLGFDLATYAQSVTQFGIPTTVASTKMYSTTFRSDLSKSSFDGDEVLSAWLKECDEKGEGVYVFRSREVTTNKEYAEILYFYNNTGSYRFSVESVEESKEGGGYYRVNTYLYTKPTQNDKLPVDYGYTLTMVYDTCPSRYVKTAETEDGQKVEVPFTVVNRTLNRKGEEDENSRTECAYVETFDYKTTKYDFDLYATEFYNLNVYGDLYVGDFYENKAIYNELRVLLERAETQKENLGFHWVDTSNEEKDYHTFVLFRRNMKYKTLVDVVPSLHNGEFTLVVNYDEQEHTGEIENPPNYGVNGVRPGKRYALYYITLEVAKGANVSISYNLSETKADEVTMGLFTHEYTKDNAKVHPTLNDAATFDGLIEIATPIEFEVCGMLNTELIKYMKELNDFAMKYLDLSDLDSDDKMEILKNRVEYLSILLNTEAKPEGSEFPLNGDEMYDETIDALIKDETSIIYKGGFDNLFYQLTHITNHGTMEDVKGELSKIGNGDTKEADEYRPIFYSPYGIYYLWMEALQYLPAGMATTK